VQILKGDILCFQNRSQNNFICRDDEVTTCLPKNVTFRKMHANGLHQQQNLPTQEKIQTLPSEEKITQNFEVSLGSRAESM